MTATDISGAADLGGAWAALRAEAEERGVPFVELLIERGLLTRADLRTWEAYDTRAFARAANG